MDAILAILFILLVVGLIVELFLHDLLLSRLRARHPDIWQALGPPTKYFDDGGMERRAAMEEFLRRPEYLRQCGEDLCKLAHFIRIYDRVFVAVVVVLLVACAVDFIGQG